MDICIVLSSTKASFYCMGMNDVQLLSRSGAAVVEGLKNCKKGSWREDCRCLLTSDAIGNRPGRDMWCMKVFSWIDAIKQN